jgi:energy-converting hydrogenase A subunit M
MDHDQEILELMKTRIIRSYKWRDDIVKPLSSELEIDYDEFEQILINKLDMSSLEALHPRFESARPRCIKERLHADLRLCWLADVMEIVSPKEADAITSKITQEILDGVEYDKALEDGRHQLLKLIRE